MRHVIEVTQGDIEEAIRIQRARIGAGIEDWDGPLLSSSCPVALAAARALKAESVQTVLHKGNEVEPSRWHLWVYDEMVTERVQFVAPPEVEEFIQSFDSYERDLLPFSFVVEDGE